ncbi:MAG TPA: glycosyltransferase [Fimbriimonadaceae bacterium]|nr:glycosyltransferase [Fimbriimonadaceae bacterium]
MKRGKPQIPVCYCLHDDHWYLDLSIKSFLSAGPVICFISRVAWDGSPGAWQCCAEVASSLGAEVVLGDWPTEELHRGSALSALRERGFSFVLTPDGDEIIEGALLEALLAIAQKDLADRAMCCFDTYWKSPEYVIRPRESIRPLMLVNLNRARHVFCREYEGGRPLVLPAEYGLVHHLSYAGPNERILRKLSTWGHKDEVLDGWYARVWLAWDQDPLMHDLHPTHPRAYGYAERISPPALLGPLPVRAPLRLEGHLPTVSVVVPLYGGCEDIELCLRSLAGCADLLHEVLVVDDCSPDEAASVVVGLSQELSEFVAPLPKGAEPKVGAGDPIDSPQFLPGPIASCELGERKLRLLRNEANVGFAATCNRGYLASSGEVLVFLNSDTVVPRAGLIRLIEALATSGTVGAAGPYTNRAGYEQPIDVTYSNLERMHLFAEDFAQRNTPDIDATMLVGFCLAVRRTVIEEVGEVDGSGRRVPFDARFGRGMFEDNDLCYRIQRAGYKTRIAARSFVHHAGSRSLGRMEVHPQALLEGNKQLYHEKWREEIESGFASHLPGQRAEPVVFRPDRHPDRIRRRIQELARKADISLCMIVRDEERVLDDCLRSARGAFTQIVVVDTGSTDRTKEIAKEHGAEVIEIPWPDSFAEARNESLRHAKGRWVFWMDADDTLPLETVLALLRAAVNARKCVVGFVVPVQFVETAGATRVDHVKLFRNLPGLQFEGRIHEQILRSLRSAGGEIARLSAVVLHSGYDTSVAGQAKKRVRDEKLLKLDLEDRPNHPFVLFNLGMTAHYCEDHADAIAWLERSLAVSQNDESHVRKIYALMGISHRRLGNPGLALETFEKGLEAVGEDPELRFQLALTLTELGRYADAKAQYLAMRPEYEDHFSSFDVSILGFKRFFNLASICLLLDQYLEARDWLRKAMEMETGRYEAAESLFRASMARRDLVTASEALDQMLRARGYSEDWVRYRLDYATVRGDNPEEALRTLVQNEPTAMAPRLLLVRNLLERGHIHSAMPHLEFLDQIGCAEAAFFRGVCATRQGDYRSALTFMKRARDLNPNHEQTLHQIQVLEGVLGAA